MSFLCPVDISGHSLPSDSPWMYIVVHTYLILTIRSPVHIVDFRGWDSSPSGHSECLGLSQSYALPRLDNSTVGMKERRLRGHQSCNGVEQQDILSNNCNFDKSRVSITSWLYSDPSHTPTDSIRVSRWFTAISRIRPCRAAT